MVPGLYALGGLFALDTVRQAFSVAPRLGQVLLVGETLVGSMVAGWMLGHLRRAPGATAGPSGLSALRLGTWLFLLTFAAGLVASSLGYVRLARLMTSGILAGGVLALTLAASCPGAQRRAGLRPAGLAAAGPAPGAAPSRPTWNAGCHGCSSGWQCWAGSSAT